MKHFKKSHLLIFISILFLLASCAIKYPVSQPSGSQLQLAMPKDSYTILGTAEATGCDDFLIGIPLGGNFSFKDTIDMAVKAKGGDLFVQTSTDRKSVGFPSYLFGIWKQECITVQGIIVKFK